MPEFDGRLITVPFSFKEIDEDGLPAYVADPERAARVAGHRRTARPARATSRPPTSGSRSSCPRTRPSTPASATRSASTPPPAPSPCCAGCAPRATTSGPRTEIPGLVSGDGDELIYALIEAGGHDQEWLTEEQLARNPVRIPAADYRRWYATLPAGAARVRRGALGPAARRDVRRPVSRNPEGDIVLAALRRGNLLILIQPPRGFGENPIAIYHDPDLPPSHHYLAAYRWIAASAEDGGFGADAMIHLGKHGNLEWLPGKNAGLSAACGPDAALGDLPLVYPFLVNDPGEGTQAKRRVHATLVDHLVPPMARADSLRRHRAPGTTPGRARRRSPRWTRRSCRPIRAQIWTLIQAAKLDHDLGLEDRPEDEGFDDFLLHRRRLALRDQGRPDPRRPARPGRRPGRHGPRQPRPRDPARPPDLGRHGRPCPACARRSAWTSPRPPAPPPTTVEEQARALVQAMDDADWDPGGRRRVWPTGHPQAGRRHPRLRRPRGRARAWPRRPTSSTTRCTR